MAEEILGGKDRRGKDRSTVKNISLTKTKGDALVASAGNGYLTPWGILIPQKVMN